MILNINDKTQGKMKRVLFSLLLWGVISSLSAQTVEVRGRVVDQSTGQPLPFATVAIFKADSTVLAGAVADVDGAYQVTVGKPSHKQYTMSVTFIGYRPFLQTITFSDPVMQLADIALVPDATMLQAVEIVERAPVIEQQVDKLVMNVSRTAFAQSNNALDLLRKAPGVSIDKDGNVQLNGQAVSVWIDGRPSHLDGKSLEMLLRSTDGTTIDKIEIMANPSSKYDAEGQGGIINIRTTKTFVHGINGTLSADAGGMWFDRSSQVRGSVNQFFLDHNVSANINYRTDKTNTYLQLSESAGGMGVDLVTHTTIPMGDTLFEQRSKSLCDIDSRSYVVKVGNDWFIDKHNTVGISFTMPMSTMDQWDDSSFSIQTLRNDTVQRVLSNPITQFAQRQYKGNINFTHIFNEAVASEITVNIDFLRNALESTNLQTNSFLSTFLPGTVADSVKVLSLVSDNMVDIYSAKADWQGVVGNGFFMEAGAKWARSHSTNFLTQVNRCDMAGVGVRSDTVENPFDYTETVGAAYATVSRQFGPCWSAKVGLRGEYTNAHNTTDVVKQNYFDLFPTAYVGYSSPDMMKRASLSYTRRIARPRYNQLNPFRNYVDAHTCNEGNPDLKPAYSDNFALTVGFGRYVTLSGNYIYTKDQHSIRPILDPLTGEQVMKHDNFGTTALLGGGVTLTELPLGKLFTFTLNAYAYDYFSSDTATESRVSGMETDEGAYRVHSLLASLYGCLTLNLKDTWKIQLDGNYTSPMVAGYMQTRPMGLVNLGVKKTALDGRLILTLNFNDLFRTMNNSFDVIYSNDIASQFSQRYLIQKVSVGLQWNFGAAQRPLRQRNVGILDESSRVDSGSGLLN